MTQKKKELVQTKNVASRERQRTLAVQGGGVLMIDRYELRLLLKRAEVYKLFCAGVVRNKSRNRGKAATPEMGIKGNGERKKVEKNEEHGAAGVKLR